MNVLIPTRLELESLLLLAGKALLVVWIASLILGSLAIVAGGVWSSASGIVLRIHRRRTRKAPLDFGRWRRSRAASAPVYTEQLQRLELDGLVMSPHDLYERRN